MLRGADPPELIAAMAARSPRGPIGEPDDAADVGAFLCGPDARWVTGHNIRAGGGVR